LIERIDECARRPRIPRERQAERHEVDATEERFPELCEATAYFVVSEALANVAKHARASHASIAIRHDGDVLRVEVGDDGEGGASLDEGGGLHGLVDRVAAVGGTLTVDSPPAGGTRIVAEIPCG
jgi:signal transduction histidine kinase